MDLSDPTRSISSTLDGTVVAVLAAAGSPLTVGEIARAAPRGSEVGIRRATDRLVAQGTVSATQMGANRVLELNRDHVAAAAAELLAGLRRELWRRMRTAIAEWDPAPSHASVFGSAARGDGGLSSDIDILLVRPPFAGDFSPGWQAVAGIVSALGRSQPNALVPMERELAWQVQIEDLHDKVVRWAGNTLHVVEVPMPRWFLRAPEDGWLRAELQQAAVELGPTPARLARATG